MATTPTSSTSFQPFAELNIREYLAMLRRRRFWILLSASAFFIASAVLVWRLPNVYRCQTTILVDPQKVPDNYVKSTVTQSIADRLSTIQEQVIAPAALKKLIDTMGLYPELRKQVGDQDLIRLMQKSITVEPVTSMGTQLSAFRIIFKGRNPVEVTQVTNQLAAMFIEQNLKVREQQSYGTADFLESELEKTAQQLKDKENELSETRSRYLEDLPESEQFHVQQAESLRMELRAANDRVNRDLQEKTSLQSLMAASAPTVDLDLNADTSASHSRIESLESKLSALRNRYGPQHPDVRRLEAQLSDLKAQEPAQTAQPAPVPAASQVAAMKHHNPVLEAQLEKLDEDIAQQRTSVASLQKEIDFHISKVQQSPIFWQKTADITRDYDALKARYSQLLEKKLSADTASAMESRQKSERFVILDPAQIPEKPSSPNRPLLLLGGLLGGFFLGIGVAFVMHTMDESAQDSQQVEKILGAPVLSGVPEILTDKQRWSRRMRLGAISATAVTTAVAVGLVAAHISLRFI